MENASKALLMAASVLIGILIISLAIYLFVSFGSTSAEVHKQNEVQQIAQFNSRFTSYEQKTCTIYDVVTLANLATENNIYYELTSRQRNSKNVNYITVKLDNLLIEGNYEDSDKNEEYNRYLEKELKELEDGKEKKYKCKTEISEITQRVYQVNFTSL